MSSKPLVLQVETSLEADRMLIGGKAASLVTLSKMGAAVPAAFVLTTEAYRQWARGEDDRLLDTLIKEGLAGLESRTGLEFGAKAGLVVSVRSGAPVSMPGMMDTVLNVGVYLTGGEEEPFLYDARARFLWQYAEIVLEFDKIELEKIRSQFPAQLDATEARLLARAIADVAARQNKAWPSTPMQEINGAARAVFASWQSSRAKLYRRMRKIDDSLGTSVTVQQMVFGNRDSHSGSGVAFTRDPTTGSAGLSGEFLVGGQGEEVVAGREKGIDIRAWQARQPGQFSQLEMLARSLEETTRKVHEIEFTIDRGRFYVLQCRPARLTARAAARVAVDLVREQRLLREEALDYAKQHGFDPDADPTRLAIRPDAIAVGRGIAVGGGVGIGRLALTQQKAEELIREGDAVVFATVETSPGLLPVMQHSAALITMRGGATSHAAVVARELGIPCVVGVGAEIGAGGILLGTGLQEGKEATVDGDTGELFSGDVSIRTSQLSDYESTLRRWSALGGADETGARRC